MFQVGLKGVSRVFERRLKGVFGSFMGVSIPFKGVSRKFLRSFMGVLRVFQENFNGI